MYGLLARLWFVVHIAMIPLVALDIWKPANVDAANLSLFLACFIGIYGFANLTIDDEDEEEDDDEISVDKASTVRQFD